MSTNESFDTELEYKINFMRFKMVITGMVKGLSHPTTIEYSQKLDLLLNEQTKVRGINLN